MYMTGITAKVNSIDWGGQRGLPDDEEYSIGLPTLCKEKVFHESTGVDEVRLEGLLKSMLADDYGTAPESLAFSWHNVYDED